MKPFFSVIIPALNEAKYLPLLLKDLSNQSFKDFEVIIVDGQSEDQTVSKAQAFEKKLPKLTIANSQVRHVCHQRNLGASLASAEYLVFIDADIRIPSYCLVGLKYKAESSNADLFTTWTKPDGSDAGTQAIASVINIWLDLQKNSDRPVVIEGMFVIKKKVFQTVKGFNPKMPIHEGFDLVGRAIKKGYRYTVFKDPPYTFSLRRLRQQGILKTIASLSQIEFARLTSVNLPLKKIRSLYPMEGGLFFDRTENGVTLTRIKKRLQLKKYQEKFFSLVRSILFTD